VRTVSCGGACPGSGMTLSSRLLVAAGGGGSGAVGQLSPGGTGGAAEAPGGNGDGFCQKTVSKPTAGSVTLVTKLTSNLKKLKRLKPNTRTWKRATLSLTYKEGLSSTTLSYALDAPLIMSISTGSLEAGSEADIHVTLKIHYESMTSAGCIPKSSCGV